MEDKFKKLYKIILINIFISCLNGAILGSVIFMMIGYYSLPLLSSVLCVSASLCGLLRSKLQMKFANYTLLYLNDMYLKMQYYDTMLTALSFIFLAFYFKFGIGLLLLSYIFGSVTNAYKICYNNHVDDMLCNRDTSQRTKLYAKFDLTANVSSILGTIINAIIFYISKELNIANISTYQFICALYGVLYVVDLLCSHIEKRELNKILS